MGVIHFDKLRGGYISQKFTRLLSDTDAPEQMTRIVVCHFTGIACAQIELGQLQATKASFQKSLKIEPKNKLALSELKYIAKLEKEQAPKDTPPKE